MIQARIKDLIALSKIEQAIDEYLSWAGIHDTDIENELIVIKSRYTSLSREIRLGLLSNSEQNVELAKIRNSLLSLANLDNVPTTIVVAPQINVVTYNFNIRGTDYADPEAFKKFVNKERYGVPSEYKEAIQFGKAVLGYTKSKFDERTFEMEFTALRYAVKDLEDRQNMPNLEAVINQVKKYEADILDLLQAEAKEGLLQKLYNDANENKTRLFPEQYELFLKKYLEIKAPNDTATMNMWYYDRNEFYTNIAGKSDLFTKSQINLLRTKWMDTFKP